VGAIEVSVSRARFNGPAVVVLSMFFGGVAHAVDCTPRTFAGSFPSPCAQFDDNETSCNQAWAFTKFGDPVSCFFVSGTGRCEGCGPVNQNLALCENACALCAEACQVPAASALGAVLLAWLLAIAFVRVPRRAPGIASPVVRRVRCTVSPGEPRAP
jgi:hypothetical protein